MSHLRYFVTVADEGSVTKAAKLLRLAQPSLTRQIKNLEEELHVSLFQREKKRLELTEDGRFFLTRARRLLSQAEEDVDAKRWDGSMGDNADPGAGLLTIACVMSSRTLRHPVEAGGTGS